MLTPDNLSVQLYTLRDRFGTEPETVLEELAEAGLRQVEPYDLVAFRSVLDKGLAANGLRAPSTHLNLFDLSEAEVEPALDVAAELGVELVVQPVSPATSWTTEAGVAAVADALNRFTNSAGQRGLTVGYHNHTFEFAHDFDGRFGLEVLLDHLDERVQLQIDTYWALLGGADVPALLRGLGDRVTSLHLKDGDGLPQGNQVAAGLGVVPMLDYVSAAQAMRWGVIELDGTDGDEMTAVRDSFDYLNGK